MELKYMEGANPGKKTQKKHTETGEEIRNLVVSLPGKTGVACELFRYQKYSKFRQCGRFETVLHDTVLHTDALCQISRSWPVWFLRKM